MLVLQGVLIGIGATAAMDVWAWLLSRLAGQPKANWGPVGRWFWHLPRGRVFHDDIALARPYGQEVALGWAAHYAVGIVYGILFALIMGAGWFAAPRLVPALVFAILTIAAGWFLLQPGMGHGWAAARTPNPGLARIKGLAAHAVFGLGLYGSALLIR